MSPAPLRLATRSSPLARCQADRVAAALGRVMPAQPVEIVLVSTIGDRRREVPIAELAGRGVFTSEVDAALLDGRADLAVHSAKDLPAAPDDGALVLCAVPERADVRDALVGRPLAELAPGALVRTGAVRRRAQLAAHRPDLAFGELRGNIGTRLDRVPPNGAVVVALAALVRLGLEDRVAEVLSTEIVLPQVGQGAIALRARAEDERAIDAARALDDVDAHRAVLAERAFLATLGGGCDAPVGALARLSDGGVAIDGLVASRDGRTVLRRSHAGRDPVETGRECAQLLLAHDGALALLEGAG